MARRTGRKRTTPRHRKHSATNVPRQPKEPRSGSMRSTLDPRLATVPEQTPSTEGPSSGPWWGSREQSGDLEGLETDESESNESVAELADEGQDLEAEELEGVEEARDPDQGALPRRKVPNRQQPRAFKNRNRL